jgi:hypothetical protein
VVEVGDIARGEAKRYLETHFATPVQRKAMHDIACCRTAAMGVVPQKCDECEIEYWLYRSCGNRSCPLCQSEAREKWLEARRQEILPVEYLQVVFTPPRELNVLAMYCPEAFYDALIRAAGQAIIDVGWSQLHARLGCQVHLQTWTQTMALHPHTHCVVPCGGFSEDKSRWVPFGPDDLPTKTLSNRFRSLLDKFIRAAAQQGKLERLPNTISVEQLLATVRTRPWRVYAKPPFGGPEKLFEYLSRYTIVWPSPTTGSSPTKMIRLRSAGGRAMNRSCSPWTRRSSWGAFLCMCFRRRLFETAPTGSSAIGIAKRISIGLAV